MDNNCRLMIIVLAAVLSLISQGMCAIELFPFGSSAGDTLLTDERAEASFEYMFFGEHYQFIYVSLFSAFMVHHSISLSPLSC